MRSKRFVFTLCTIRIVEISLETNATALIEEGSLELKQVINFVVDNIERDQITSLTSLAAMDMFILSLK